EENITRLYLYNKEIVLIGTAHVSKHSAAQVKDVIEGEQPDTVCVELDQQRYQSIVEKTKWQEMDIFKVIKERKAILLLVNLVVSSFQKRMAKQFGIRPGEEMIDRKSTRLNSSHVSISYAVFCLKKKNKSLTP